LGQREFDVLIVGGGVTGAGTALEATTRGLRAALSIARRGLGVTLSSVERGLRQAIASVSDHVERGRIAGRRALYALAMFLWWREHAPNYFVALLAVGPALVGLAAGRLLLLLQSGAQ